MDHLYFNSQSGLMHKSMVSTQYVESDFRDASLFASKNLIGRISNY